MSKTIRSACRNKHEEDWEGFYLAAEVKPFQKRLSHLSVSLNTSMEQISKWYKSFIYDRDLMLGWDEISTFEQWLSVNEKVTKDMLVSAHDALATLGTIAY